MPNKYIELAKVFAAPVATVAAAIIGGLLKGAWDRRKPLMPQLIQMSHQSTSDMYLAAYAQARGITFVRIDDDAGKRCLFVFDVVNVEAWREVQGDFVSGRGVVKAVDYASAIKNLKSAVVGYRRSS